MIASGSAIALFAGLASLAIWVYLFAAHGQFWRERVRNGNFPQPAQWPRIAAVMPARNEAACIAASLGSLIAQDYPGEFSIFVVDDHSDDGTGDMARAIAASGQRPVTVVSAAPRPNGWTGKVWAMDQGVAAAQQTDAEFILLTDADVMHHGANLRELVMRAQAERRDLVSVMPRLHCDTMAERALIPAFAYFFGMVYPFRWVADQRRLTAGAAGGCMLTRRTALERIGGIARIRTALIDDCALAGAIKPGSAGGIWLGLSEATRAVRVYSSLAEIWQMIARSGFTQLGYSYVSLAAAAVAMFITFLVPPVLVVFGTGWMVALGLLLWLAMTVSFQPTLRFYRCSPLWGPAMPAIAAAYLAATFQSAWRYRQGRGGEWKGRAQAHAADES